MGNVMPEQNELMLVAVEQELADIVNANCDGAYSGLREIFHYQMGWETGTNGTTGKRIRPLLLLLTVIAFEQDWQKALPAAAALELLHNYSLIHDDIEDNSTLRRGKETIWVRWGQPQGINSGDAMLNLALAASWRLIDEFPIEKVAKIVQSIQRWSLELTKGQYLDISFEYREDVSLEDYFEMVEGKTCSLLKAALEMGGILAGVEPEKQRTLVECGSLLGRAYQVQDDWLGIWGKTAEIGKSNQSDLLERKTTFPILLGLENKSKFAAMWNRGKFEDSTIPVLAALLADEGVKEKCEAEFSKLFAQANNSLESLKCNKDRLAPLTSFVQSLLKRKF
jgi:geranylgeranyl diphosphate synthase type I